MSWSKWFIAAYVVACTLVLLFTYQALDLFEAQQVQSIEKSTLFYVSRDRASTDVALWARQNLKIKTIDLLAPGAGNILYKLTGARRANSPTLVMPKPSGVEIASGPAAVEQALKPVTTKVAPVQLGKRAVVMMGAVIILAFAFHAELSLFASFLPIPGIAAISMLWGQCWSCGTNSSFLSAVAPIGGLIYLAGAISLFSIPLVSRRSAYWFFLLTSSCIPLVQCYLLLKDPKLCPSCLILTFISAAYLVATIKVIQSSRIDAVKLPKIGKLATIMTLLFLFTRHSLVFAGVIKIGEPSEVVMANVMAAPISKFLRFSSPPPNGTLYVVSQEGCHACDKASKDLAASKIKWVKVPVCTLMQSSECFDGESLTFVTPLLLIAGEKGQIIFQHNGWPDSATEVSGLTNQIQGVQRRFLTRQRFLQNGGKEPQTAMTIDGQDKRRNRK